MPGGYRQLSPALPPGATTDALRRVDYFDPGAALGPIAVLAAWTLGGLILLVSVRVAGNRRRTRRLAAPAAHRRLGERGEPRDPRAGS